MALKKIYLEGVPGLTYVQDPELVNVQEIFQVMREGRPRFPTTGTPTGNQFFYNAAEGKIEFPADQPFAEAYGEFDYLAQLEMNYIKYTKEP